ncbi:MAG: hypothetical protein AAFR39_00105 [Pseudomonadota bacterium]
MIALIPRSIIFGAQAQALAGQLKQRKKLIRRTVKQTKKPDQRKSIPSVQ